MSCCFDGNREWGIGNRESAPRLNGNDFHARKTTAVRSSLCRHPIPDSPFPAKA